MLWYEEEEEEEDTENKHCHLKGRRNHEIHDNHKKPRQWNAEYAYKEETIAQYENADASAEQRVQQ